MNDKLPSTNMPVSIFGQVPRDQREQELEFFLSKQYNTVGLRIQNKLNIMEAQFSQSNISINNPPAAQFISNSFMSNSSASLNGNNVVTNNNAKQ